MISLKIIIYVIFESNILNKFLTNKLDYINENSDKNMIFDKESFSFEIKEKDHQKLFDYLEIKSNSLKISVYISMREIFNKERKTL